MPTNTQNDTPAGQSPVLALAPGWAPWIAVADELPRKGQRVLVAALNGIHVWRTVAQYWPAGTMDASDWDDPPEDWWDEDGERCTNPEAGWYEAQLETETNWLLTGVSHWAPLPPLPALPNGRDQGRADSAQP